MPATTIGLEINDFLRKNCNRWFTSQEIAKALNRQGKQINAQCDAAVSRTEQVRFDELILKGKQRRLVYGWFEDPATAVETEPSLKHEKRTLK